MLYFLGILLLLHGLLHLLGFSNAFGLGALAQLDSHIPKPLGILWLGVAMLLVFSSIVLFMGSEKWWLAATIAIILSQVLIFSTWNDARYGTILNFVILLAILNTWGNVRFANTFKQDVEKRLDQQKYYETELLTETDLQPLPIPVQRYLRKVGVVNKPKVKNARIVFEGQMRQRNKDYFSFTSEQYNFFDEPGRYFFMKGKMFKMTVPGYHRYENAYASMDIRLFGLYPIINHTGGVMNKSETVTFFNEMCLLAPATLIDNRIQWKEINEHVVEATFINKDIKIKAVLYFNSEGLLVNFVSNDRTDVNEMEQYPFSTPISGYQSLHGLTIMANGDGVWSYPEENFTYGKFILKEVEYNMSKR